MSNSNNYWTKATTVIQKSLRKRTALSRSIAAFLMGGSMFTATVHAQTNNYYGTTGALSGNVWNTNPAGPYTSALNSTGGAIINFGNAATLAAGANTIVVAGINATANFSITGSPTGTISNFSNSVIPITVANGVTLDFGSQAFTTSATAGYTFDGNSTGVLALAGNTYGGGFTLNSGTLIVRGVNAMGSGGVLTINGGTIAANATRDLTGKYSNIVVGGDFTLGASTGLAVANSNLTFSNTMSLGAATRSITIGGTGVYTLGGVISGAAGTGLIVNSSGISSAGAIILTGANTYDGGTTVNSGTLSFRTIAAKPSTGTHTFAAGSTLGLGIVGVGAFTPADVVDAFAATPSATNLSGIAFDSDMSIGIDIGGTATTFSSNIGPSTRGLTKLPGNANLTLTGANQYSGRTVVKSGSALIVNSLGNIADTSSNVGTNSTIDLAEGGRIDVSTASSSDKNFNLVGSSTIFGGTAGPLVLSGTISTETAGTKTLSLGTNAATTIPNEVSGNITNGSGTLAVAKINSGRWILSGNNTFTGGVTISAGTLQLGSTGALNSTAGAQNAVAFGAATSGNLALAGNSVVVANLTGSAVGPVVQNANGSAVPNATLTVGNSTNLGGTYAGSLQDGTGGGTLAVTKTGSDRLILSGTNTYTGVTTISAGLLQFSNRVSLYNGLTSSWTKANFNVSGTLGLNVGGTNQFTTTDVATLITNLTGTVSNNGLRSGSRIGIDTTNASGGTFTIANNITNTTGTGGGAIGLNKMGSGVLILTGTNTYTGGTTIGPIFNASQLSGGTLRVTTGAIGTGGIGLNNGTLASASSAPVTIPGNISNTYVDGTMTFGDSIGTGVMTLTGGISLSGSGSGRTINTAADVIVTGVLSGSNSSFLTKSGAATLTLSNVAGTTNGLSNIIVTAGTLAVTRLANSTVNSSIGRTTVASNVASITLDGGALNYINGGAAASSTDRLLQIGRTAANGTGTIRNNATSATEILTFSNTNPILYGTTNQTRTLILGGTNTGLNTILSPINNNGTGVVTLTKQDPGTWVLPSTNNYTGVTTVAGGRLVLDYLTNDTSKLSDTTALTLGGTVSGGVGGSPVTLELKEGSHIEIVGSTSLTAGTSSAVVRNSGSAILRMNAITFNAGSTIDFGADNIASTSTANNATGILSSGATVAGADWAINSGTMEGGISNFITTYTGYTDVARLGTPAAGIRIIDDGSTTNVRLIEGSGDSGTITLGAATTSINTLNQSISGGTGSATIDLPAQTFRTNAILMGPTAGALTIGAAGGSATVSGTLTNQTGAGGSLIFTNNSTSDMTINSVLAENSTTNTFSKAGTGTLILAGDNTFNVPFTIQDGIVKAGKNSTSNSVGPFGGAVASASIIIANKATAGLDINGFNVFVKDLQGGGSLGGNVTLSSGNTLTITNPASGSAFYTGTISGSGNLAVNGSSQQTFNSAHTYTGTTTLLGATLSVNSLANGGVASGIGQSSSAASNLVFAGGALAYNSTAAASTNREFTLGGNATINVVGGGSLTFTSTAAITHSVTTAKTLTLGGNGVGGGTLSAIIGDNTGATSVTKTGTGSWTLGGSGANTYTGLTTVIGSSNTAGALILAKTGGVLAVPGNLTIGNGTATQAHVLLGGNEQISPAATITLNGINGGWAYLQLQGRTQTIGNIVETNPGFGVIETRELQAGTFGTSNVIFNVASGTQTYQGYFRDRDTGLDATNSLKLTKTGAGTLQWGAANTAGAAGTTAAGHAYSGGTEIQNGTLQLLAANTASAISIVGAGNVSLNGGATFAGTLDLNGLNAGITGLDGTAGTVLGQVVNNVNATTANLTIGNNGNSGTYAGLLSDNNNAGTGILRITKVGAGTQVLSGANTYTGGTTIASGGGILRITNPSALGSGTVTNSNGGILTGMVELQLTGTNTLTNNWTTVSANQFTNGGFAHIRNVSGDNTLSGTITLINTGGNGTNIESNGGLLTLTGAIRSTVADNSRTMSFGGTGAGLITGSGNIADTGANILAVAKSGSGTWTFDSTNTYTGVTTISAGTLELSGGSAIVDTNTLTLANAAGAVLKLNASETIGSVTGGGTTGGNVNLQGFNLTVQPTGSGTFSGNISGVGGLIKRGTANYILQGDNTAFTGPTTVEVGYLVYDSLTAENGVGPLALNGGNLALGAMFVGQSATIGSLSGTSATSQIDPNYDAATGIKTLSVNQTTSGTFAGRILTGTGSRDIALTKTGSATLTLTGANTYTGGTTVNAGTLFVNNTTGSGTGTGAVNVSALATLGGTGTISGLTTVVSTGVLSPNTTGTIGTLTLNGGLTTTGASLVFDLGTPASSDKLDLGATGVLTSTGGLNAFTFAGTPTAGTYTLIDYGTFSGVLGDFTAPAMVNGLNATLSNDTGLGAIVLTLAPAGPDQWIGTGNWTTTANWQGAVPNSLTAVASFLGMGTGGVSVDMPQTVNQIVFNDPGMTPVSYSIGGPSTLSVAGTTPTITNTTGTNTITAPLNLANGTAVTVTAGSLAISPATANTVGTGVTATVATGATLTLGGAGSGLNSTTNIANAGTLSVSGTAQSVGNISGAGSTTVSGAGNSTTPSLIANDIDQTGLTINNGAYVRIAPSGTSTSALTSLTMGATANLDIGDNDVVINNPTPVAAASSLAAVAASVNAGFAGSDGIVTNTFTTSLETVGFGLNDFLSFGSFGGVTVNSDSVLIKYTYFGDSNLDGFVTDDDLGYFLAGYGTDVSANPWVLGDYNHDGFTTDDDLGFFLAAYGTTPGLAGGGIQAIPEPSTLVLGTLAGLGLGSLSLRRRRAK
jgi:fibronectin-binding autotransporter adhesin